MAKRYVLSSEIARVRSKNPDWELQLPPATSQLITDDKGAPLDYAPKVLKLPSAATMSDEVVLYSNTQPVRAAKLLLGDDWDHFQAAGGTAQVLWSIVQENAQADQGE